MYKSGPRYTSGIGALEVVSPELRKALGIEKPQQFDPKTLKRIPREDETPRPFRPQGLGNIFVPEDTKQSAEARSMLGSGIMGQGVSPGFSQALTGSPIGASTQAEVLKALTNPQIIQDKASKIVDDFSEVNEASDINNKLQGLESDIVTSTIDDFDAGLADSTGATDGSTEGTEGTEGKDTGENLTAAQTATKTALSEFLAQARPGVKPQKYDEYIKEFGDATGLDISGEPDTKQALMSFGLALMQNRAGKGFDISKILTSTGEAGEAAMPDFRKAVTEAKTIRAKAGEYALGKTKEDKTAAMNRKNYVIVPKGTGGIKGLAKNLDKSENVPLNSYELNSLVLNKKFNEQYEILPDSQYNSMLTAALKTPELGKKYLNKIDKLELFKDAPEIFQVAVQYGDGNYKGSDAPNKPLFRGDKELVMKRFKSMRRDIDRGKAQFKELVGEINKEGVTVFQQTKDGVKAFASAFGVNLKDDATSTQKIDLILKRIQSKWAPEILGESGKTISDADRERVAKIVGDLKFIQDEDALKDTIRRVFEDIIGGQERKLKDGLTAFNGLIGQSVQFDSGAGLNDDEKTRLKQYEDRRKQG